jgi:aspartyl aminopeptidase
MDVSCLFDPSYPDAFEKQNTAVAGCGVVLEKYSGARGKSGSNDAHSEYMYRLRALFARSGVVFQTGEMGKIDAGGSGTVAYLLAKYGADTVDLGVGVLSMHAPCELISKADLYSAYRAALAFYAF